MHPKGVFKQCCVHIACPACPVPSVKTCGYLQEHFEVSHKCRKLPFKSVRGSFLFLNGTHQPGNHHTSILSSVQACHSIIVISPAMHLQSDGDVLESTHNAGSQIECELLSTADLGQLGLLYKHVIFIAWLSLVIVSVSVNLDVIWWSSCT